MNIKVVNNRNLAPEIGWTDIYVGRGKGSQLGNPFVMQSENDRPLAISKYREWLWDEIKKSASPVKDALFEIAKKVKLGDRVRLVCWCKQSDREVACHADIIVRAIAWLIKTNQI